MGAAGFIPKNATAGELRNAVEAALSGETYVPREHTDGLHGVDGKLLVLIRKGA